MTETLVVSEIYRSIQGESSWVGLPCTFIRLAGCNLRCRWCDSAHTFHGGEKTAIDDIVRRVEELATELVEVTGGEPLLQPRVHDLMGRLLDLGRRVLLETSGSVDLSRVNPRVVKIVDLKCPDSGEVEANLWTNLNALGSEDEVKFVIASRDDYEWAREVIRSRRLAERSTLLMGVVFGALEPRLLVDWLLEDRLPVRFQLQAHKHIWPPNTRGV